MQNALTALTAELRRLKSTGVKSVTVSEEGLRKLHAVVTARRTPTALDVTGAIPPGAATADTVRNSAATTPAKSEGKALPPAPVVTLHPGDKNSRWATLREAVLNDATCREHVRPGKLVVFGVGNLDARIMFVGEAPGAEEEVQGEPFVGPAGQLLTRMISAMGLQRSDVYIGNIMNWRPQMPLNANGVQFGNRPPTAAEMNYCLPYLLKQIEVVNPQVLVALGATAAQGLLGIGSFGALGEVRGKWREFAGKPLMITYHPSYILRNQSNRSKRTIWEDLLLVMERVGLPITDKQRGFFL